MDLERDRARYEADRARDLALAATHGIDEVMKAQTARRAALSRRERRGDRRQARLPDGDRAVRDDRRTRRRRHSRSGFEARPAPYGVSFTGMACSEPRLIELAYAFEQATRRRVPPPSAP